MYEAIQSIHPNLPLAIAAVLYVLAGWIVGRAGRRSNG